MNKKMVVYHGGTEKIEKPICKIGRMNLDFGQGFYLTNIKEQAVAWANNISRNRRLPAVLNRYILDRAAIISNAKCKIFHTYDEEWLEFIVANRTGMYTANEYDYVEGGVANDRVVDTIHLYIAGLMDLKSTLKELSKHQPNNQMCLLNQSITDKYLVYDGTEKL